MKIYWTALFMLLRFIAFTQTPTGDIEKDTALARQYSEEAVVIQNLDSTAILIEKAILLYEKHPFNEHLLKLKGRLASVYYESTRRTEAKVLALETIKLGEENLQNAAKHPSLGMAYFVLSTYYGNGNSERSIEYGYRAMECFESVNNKHYFKISSAVVHRLAYLNQLEEVDSLIIMLEKKLENNLSLEKYRFNIYQNKMVYYFKLNNYDNAIIYGNKFFNENDKVKAIKPARMSPYYVMMGQIYTNIRKYKEAIKWTEKAINVTSVPKDDAGFGTYYNDLANIYSKDRNFEKSILFYEKGLALLASDSAKFAQGLTIDYFNYSNVYFQMGDFPNAEKYLKESKKYGLSPMHNYQLSKILASQKKLDEAIVELHKGLLQVCTYFKDEDELKNPSQFEKYKNVRMADAFLYQKCLMLYYSGTADKSVSKLQSCIELSKLSRQLRNENWQKSKGFNTSRYIQSRQLSGSYKMTLLGEYALYKIEPSEDLFEDYFKTSEQVKAMQLIETLSPSSLPEALYKEEKELLKMINNAGKELELVMAREQTDSISYYQDKLFERSLLLENHNKKILKEYPKTANDFHLLEYAKIKNIQERISANTLVLSYNIMNAETHIIAISKSNKTVKVTDLKSQLKNINKLNKLVQSRLASQKGIREQFIKTSHELYNTLIKPIEAELEGKSRLMIVLEGQLFHLPFELLLASDELKPYHELDFLIKKYEINYHYSATAFLKLQEKATVQDNSLLAFAPIFTKGEELTEANRSLDFLVDSLYRSIDNFEFTALPNTRNEVKAISKLVKSNNGKANVLLSKNATKDKLSKALEVQSYQFVHIATHGLVNFKNPKLSALACYSKNETMDNLMYANEIQFKDINADLVILSSCESGIGQMVVGEGLIALNRSFIYSGTKNVMFSLWKVSDKHSSKLMIDFYKNYFKNASYTSALRQAKLKMLENPISAQPKFWSAFVLMGE
jgi:CHAT domain-containing protein